MIRINIEEETLELPYWYYDTSGYDIPQETLDRWAKGIDEYYSLVAEIRAFKRYADSCRAGE